MNTENKPVYFTKDQLKQHLESRGINTNAKAQPIIDQLVQKGAVIEGYNDQPKPNIAQSIAGGLIKAPTDLIGAGFAGIGALGSYTGKKLSGQETTLAQEYQNQSQQVQESGANAIMQPLTGEKIRPAQNLQQLGGDVLQTAALAIPGGAIGKGGTTLGKIGAGLGYGAATGGAAGAGMAMSENATLEEIIQRGLIGASLGGTIGAAIPAIPALANLAKKVPDAYQAAKGLRGNIQAYVGSKTVQPTFGTAATRLTGSASRLETPLASYQKYEPMAMQAIADTKVDAPISVVGSEIGDAFKKVIDSRRAVGNVMGQELKTVGKLKTDIEPIFVNFETALNDAGLTYNGLSKKIVASDLSKVAPDDIALIEDFVGELNRIGTKPSVAQIDALISRMGDKITYAKSARGMTGTTNGERLVKATLNSLRNKFDEIPELATYAKARKDYAELSDFIDEGAGFLGKITQSGDFAKDASIAKSAVQSILNNGKKDWLLKLEALTDYPALDEATLALQAMKDAGDFRGLSLLETLSETGIPTSKAGFTQKLIDYFAEKGAKITTGSPAERTKAFLQSLEKDLKPTAPKNINKNTITPTTGDKKIPSSIGINKSDAVMTKTIPQKANVASKSGGKLISDEMVAKARAVLNKSGKPTEYRTLGITTEELQAAATIGARYIEDGVRTAVELGERLAKEGIKLTKAQLDKIFVQSQSLQKGARLDMNKIDEAEQFVGMFKEGKFSSPEMARDAKKFIVDNGLDYKKTLNDKETYDLLNSVVKMRKDLRQTLSTPKELQPLAEEAKKYKNAEEFIQSLPAGGKEGREIGIGEGYWLVNGYKKFSEPVVNSEKMVTVYRGRPAKGNKGQIVDGDFVTLNKNAANAYGTVDEIKVPEKYLFPGKDEAKMDRIYYSGKTKQQLIDLYNQVNGKK